MEPGAAGGVERPIVSPGTNPERKRQAVRFKAAHALLVAFFLLLLYNCRSSI